MKWLEKYADHAYALLRIMTGFMFSFHGAQKILGVLSEMPPPMWSQLWFGGIIELSCGLTVLLGFKTRAAAFLCSGTMAVAYFQFHWKFQMGAQPLSGNQQRRVGCPLQFRFPLHCLPGRGEMVPR